VAVPNCWLEGVSGGLVWLLPLTGLLPALALKLMLEEGGKKANGLEPKLLLHFN